MIDLALSFFRTKVVCELQLEPMSLKFSPLQLFLKGVHIKSKFHENGFNIAAFQPITKLVSRLSQFEFTAKEGESTIVSYLRAAARVHVSEKHFDLLLS